MQSVGMRQAAGGRLAVGFWDHWVPTGNDAMREIVTEWARKNRVDVQMDFITSVGQKNLLTMAAEAQAEQEILEFLARYVPKQASPMCGNSISQDRRFLVKYMPKLEAFFHYRNLDVSTLKELARRWKPEVYANFKKRQLHTALADVHESIDELVHYREHFIRVD